MAASTVPKRNSELLLYYESCYKSSLYRLWDHAKLVNHLFKGLCYVKLC